MRYEAAIKGRCFYYGDGCPGCGKEVRGIKFKRKNALFLLNVFVFREDGVLIGYLLGGQ